MGGKTPETCWAVNKRQDNILENCFIWLVIYLKHCLYFVCNMRSFGWAMFPRYLRVISQIELDASGNISKSFALNYILILLTNESTVLTQTRFRFLKKKAVRISFFAHMCHIILLLSFLDLITRIISDVRDYFTIE